MSHTPLPLYVTDADRDEISSQLIALIDDMHARHEKLQDWNRGMFSGLTAVFELPDMGLNCYINISALNCELNIVRPQITAPDEDVHVLRLATIGRIQLLEPIVPPRHLGDNNVQSHHQRMIWLRQARAKAEAGEFGYDLAAATDEARELSAR